MTPTAVGQEPGLSKKKARRSFRHGEAASPSHYGPVASTSAASVLLQANLAVDTEQQSNGSSNDNTNTNTRSDPRAGSDNSCFLHVSESTFDLVRRRFRGRCKPVMLPNSTAAAGGYGAAVSSNSSSSSSRVRLSFGPGTKIVATKEVMHTTLRCRCVFVLLCELSSTGNSNGKAPSSNPAAQTKAHRNSSNKRIDTAHLITLSPDDLFCALSVESFPLMVSTEAEDTAARGGGVGNRRGHQPAIVAACALPRAFEVVDGPAVIHRPAARSGEPWRGLEIFHSGGVGGAWRGRRVPPPVGWRRAEEGGGFDDGNRLGSIFGGGNGGKRGPAPFRLDLSAANAGAAHDGDDDFKDATPPLSGESAAAARSKKRAAGAGSSALLVCPPATPFPAATRDATRDACSSGYGDRDRLGGTSRGCHGAEAAVVALPAAHAYALAGAGGEAEDESQPPGLLPPQWASLSVDQEGRASLSAWRGFPSQSRHFPTCLSRAPDIDSGVVGLAAGALPEIAAAGEGGLVLKSLPPTMYVGVAVDGDRSGAETSTAQVGAEAPRLGGRGALLELQRGALSCFRLLPAPPSAVVTAAIDDAHGVLAVLLADQARTALLLARDGSDFPVVEEHRGISATFTGDFVGNGREQVVLLSSASAGGAGSGSGAGKSGKRGAAAAAAKAGAAGWEQLPLKTLVKKALVTDCSCVWANERREELPATPSGSSGGVNGDGGVASSGGAASTGVLEGSKVSPKGKKRQRPTGLGDEADVGEKTRGGGRSARGSASALASSIKRKNGGEPDGSHGRLGRLSSVVGVLRRRVQAEEARLLQLRQARQGKAAALAAAKLALTTNVENEVKCEGERDPSADNNGGGDRSEAASGPTSWDARNFVDGLVKPGGEGVSAAPSALWVDERFAEAQPHRTLRCTIACVRFHAPSRTLCVDAHIHNPLPQRADGAAGPAAVAAGPPVTAVVNVCLTVASASGRLATRSAVCPRLCPGESATIRACVDVPLGLLAGGGGGGGAVLGAAASLFASCTWSLGGDNVAAGGRGTRRSPATSTSAAGAWESAAPDPSRSFIFSRILISPQDMLGAGGALESIAQAPGTKVGHDTYHRLAAAAGGRRSGAVSTSRSGGGGNGNSNRVAINSRKHLGLFDVGTRLDLLLRSDPATTATTSLVALPRAVRSLSKVAALPEPWAGGAAVEVNGCSERAAECTLRAGDATSAPTVLLAVAAGVLPDGARASTDHASERGRALIVAAAAALRDEMAALEAVARERDQLGGGWAGVDKGGGGGSGGDEATRGMAEALERYRVAQMKSDVLAARLGGRLVAARGRKLGEGLG